MGQHCMGPVPSNYTASKEIYMARIVLAMSGGVDSSVAAHLLLDAGHEVIGVFMRHGEESSAVCKVDAGAIRSDETPGRGGSETATTVQLPVLSGMASGRADHKQGCCTASDAADARRVAARMGIPFYALDLTEDFSRIVDYFVDDYLSGRTPNPCVRCNQWIKFGRLFDYADGIDAEYVATGHYARMEKVDSIGQLHRGLDSNKDQSYALFGIRRDRLDRMLLPVGGFEKPRIREIAESLGLGVAGKKDSQEICFVTQGHHSDFVRALRPRAIRGYRWRNRDNGGKGRRTPSGLRSVHDRPAKEVGCRDGRTLLRRRNRARDASSCDRQERVTRQGHSGGERSELVGRHQRRARSGLGANPLQRFARCGHDLDRQR